MTIADHYAAVAKALLDPMLPISSAFASFAVAALVLVATVCLHEVGHWASAQAVGIRGRIRFFVRRGTSKYWFLSVLGVRYNDSDLHKMTAAKIRCFAAAGPLVDLTMGLVWLYGGHYLGPAWIATGVTLAGAMYLALSPMNWLPIPALRNDGYVVLRPQAIHDQPLNQGAV